MLTTKLTFKRCLLHLLAVAYPVFILTPYLSAQTEEPQLKLDELYSMSLEQLMNVTINSAGKQPEKVGDIPASVVILNRNDIETFGYVTISDVLRSVPGFFHVYDYDEDKIGVRAVLGGEIILLVNGVAQHTNQLKHFAFPAEIIERIEIVRGPMSVIYGNGAFLGSINIITTQTPQQRPQTIASVSLSHDNIRKAFVHTSSTI